MRDGYFDLTSYLSAGQRQSVLPGRPSVALLMEFMGADETRGQLPIPCSEQLRRLVERVAETRQGADILSRLERQDILLFKANSGLGGFCTVTYNDNLWDTASRSPCLVGVEGDLDTMHVESILLHELTHAAQKGAPAVRTARSATDISEIVLSVLTVEADASLTEVIHAYQRREQGKPELWNQAICWDSERESGLPPLCHALLRQVELGYSADSDETRRAMFTAWMTQSSRRTFFEDETLRTLALPPDLFSTIFNPGKRLGVADLPNFVRKPDGTSYLDGFDFSDRYVSGLWNKPRGDASDPAKVAAATADLQAWTPATVLMATLGALQNGDAAAAKQGTLPACSLHRVWKGRVAELLDQGMSDARAVSRGDDIHLFARIANDFLQLGRFYPALGERLNEVGAVSARHLEKSMPWRVDTGKRHLLLPLIDQTKMWTSAPLNTVGGL